MQHLFGAHIVKLRFNNWRKHRERQPAGSAGGGAKLVVLAKHLMSCNAYGQLLRPRGINPLYFSSIRFVVSIDKDKYLTPSQRTRSTKSSHSSQYCRSQTYSDTLKYSFFPKTLPTKDYSPLE